jgi:g-D-glutamyl-meso-diaminopimelate peptidase
MLVFCMAFVSGCRGKNDTEPSADLSAIVETDSAEYTYEEMEADLYELEERYGEFIQVSYEGKSHDGRNIYYADIGSSDAEVQIMVNAGIHGREYMTPMYLMAEVEYFLSEAVSDEKLGAKLNDIMIRVVPMINPDGIAMSQGGLDAIRSEDLKQTILDAYEYDRKLESYQSYKDIDTYLKYWKANARGVDLNRNFDIDYWSELDTERGRPSAQKFKGYLPNSENETKSLISLTDELDGLACAVSIHSQGEIIYWDCGQKGEIRAKTVELAVLANKMNGYPLHTSFTAPDASYNDWCVLELGIPSINIETGTDSCPLPIEQFETIWDQNKELLSALVTKYSE